MKNLIEPNVLETFRQKPVPFKDIAAFLNNQPDITAAHLCELIGIPVQRIYNWRNEQAKAEAMNDQLKTNLVPSVTPLSGKKKKYSAKDKLSLLKAYLKSEAISKTEILRSFGLYQSDMTRWQEISDKAALDALSKRKPRKTTEQKEVDDLKKELSIQEKTIAKLATLVVIQKKTSDILKKPE